MNRMGSPTLSILFLLISAVVYYPTVTTTTAVSQLANFDDLPISTAFLATLAPQTNPVPTPYKHLAFTGFDVGAIDIFPPSRIVSPSSPNAIGHGAVTNVVNGLPSFTTVFSASNTTSFDLQSISYACVVLSEADSNIPSSCTILFTGNKAAGGQFNESLVYTPFISATQKSSFAEGSFGSEFKGLKNVTLQITNSTTTPATTVMYFDDVKYVAHVKA